MEKILADAALLSGRLLMNDEEQYDKIAQSVVSRLSKASSGDLTDKDLLDVIDVSAQTIPYVFVLSANVDSALASGKAAPRQLPAALLPEGFLWPYIARLVLNSDVVQIRYVGTLFAKILTVVVQGAEQTRDLVPAIQLLHGVILRLDLTTSTFTSTHHSFLRLCLLAQAHTEAVDILDRPIYHVPGSVDKNTESRSYKYLCSPKLPSLTYLTPNTGLTQKVTSRMYLEYYLMGGMCYMAVGEYQKAIFCLEAVFTSPTQQGVASSIMVEAYKKWLLVCLLKTGTPPAIPKSASQSAMRHIRAIAKPYEAVVEAFKGPSSRRLRAEIEEGMEYWQADYNYGLMAEVYHAYRKFSVLRLGKTFAALPIAEISKRTSPDPEDVTETINYIQGLIASGDLSAVVVPTQSGNSQILRFLSSTLTQKTEAHVEQELAAQQQELQVILTQINATDRNLEISREYIDWLKKLKKAKDEDKKTSGNRPNAVTMDEIDEDMMEEL